MTTKGFKLDWKGKQVLDDLLDAAEGAAEEVAKDAAVDMEADAPRKSGFLADHFFAEEVERKGNVVSVKVGADRAAYYALVVEVNHKTKAGFIRAVGDRVFPRFPKAISRRLRK